VDKKTASKTFRQTLSSTQKQLPFLEKCHRSYLVNINNIKEIQGNSQNAKIFIKNIDERIPLSKSRYKNIKSKHRF
jgi:DNA-binding LytR/AlgR family response regulator